MKRLLVILGFMSFSVTAQKMTVKLKTCQTYSCSRSTNIDSVLTKPDIIWSRETRKKIYILDFDSKIMITHSKELNEKNQVKIKIDTTSFQFSLSNNVIDITFNNNFNLKYGMRIDRSNKHDEIVWYNLFDDHTIVDKFIRFKIK